MYREKLHQQTSHYGQELGKLSKRGNELLKLGQGVNSDSGVQGYTFTIDGKDYQIAELGVLGRRRGGHLTNRTLYVAFTPFPEDDLELIGGREVNLPTLTVYEAPGMIGGHLRYERGSVQRTHWWSRLSEFAFNSPRSKAIIDYVGVDLGANRVLGNLNNRLAAEPTGCAPLSGGQFGALITCN